MIKMTTELIKQWAIDRNLHTADPNKQFDKLIEEYGELVNGLNKGNKELIVDSIGDMYVVLTIMMQQINGYMDVALRLSNHYDGTATTLDYVERLYYLGFDLYNFTHGHTHLFSSVQTKVTEVIELLKVTAEENNVSFDECIDAAYNEIKDRKGKMIDGKFVKESDLID